MRASNLIVWAQSRSFPCTVLELLHACFDLTASEYVSGASSRARSLAMPGGRAWKPIVRSLARRGGAGQSLELARIINSHLRVVRGGAFEVAARCRVDGEGSTRAFADGRGRGSALFETI